ncbi:MAG: hypothetical protein JNJ93_07580 [Acinetobacter sp.]|nr:hypothetical protein [Acinetobacter sp.]
MDCFCDESCSNAESEQVSRMTNAFGSFGETKEQNELQKFDLKTVRLRRDIAQKVKKFTAKLLN